MARKPRPNRPGAVFHLATRTQGHERWFTETTRSRIVDYILEAFGSSDARLLAYVVMPNHLHLIVQQGERPLGRVMQPLLCRVAALVQRSHGIEGHVFERRYRAHACNGPDHARNAVVYAHLNPVRAGLVSDPADYPWSSHALYADARASHGCARLVLDVVRGLALFADSEDVSLHVLRGAYTRYVAWRLAADLHEATATATGDPPPDPPTLLGGAPEWYSGSARAALPGRAPLAESSEQKDRDLLEIAVKVLAENAPGFELQNVRGNSKERRVVQIRRVLVRHMNRAGRANSEIAPFLGISQQCVSKILSEQRRKEARETGRGM